jgi:multimeric flavodoxin WrbA
MPRNPLAITALIGSPRRQNTLHLVEIVEDELKKLGNVQVDYVFLGERNIEFCRGCMQCMARGWEFCPLKDDLADIMASIEKSDGVILASPVYIYHVTAQTKTFLDRLPAFCHRPAFFHKQAMAVSTTGFMGTKPTLKYMGDILGALGCRTVVTVGGQGQDKEGKLPAKLEEKARKAARRFHRNLVKGDAIPPSFASIMQFRIQRLMFTTGEAAKIFPADFEHYSKLKGRRYPVDARIRPCKLAAAWVAEKLAGVFIRFM